MSELFDTSLNLKGTKLYNKLIHNYEKIIHEVPTGYGPNLIKFSFTIDGQTKIDNQGQPNRATIIAAKSGEIIVV